MFSRTNLISGGFAIEMANANANAKSSKKVTGASLLPIKKSFEVLAFHSINCVFLVGSGNYRSEKHELWVSRKSITL